MILVTGASGTVGSEVVAALSELEAPFRAAVHKRKPRLEGASMKLVPLDFDDPESLPAALDGIDTVYLLSQAIAHERALVAAARRAGVKRIVKHSAWRAGDGAFTYGRWHREIERAIEESGMSYTFLRPNAFMQNFVTFMGASIRDEGKFFDSIEDAQISYIDARDIGRAAARVLTERGHDGRAYDLSGPRALGHVEVAEILSRALGRRIEYVRVGDADYRQGCLDAGVSEVQADALVDLNRYFRSGACAPTTRAVRDLTGLEPRSFEEVARELAPAFAPVRSEAEAPAHAAV